MTVIINDRGTLCKFMIQIFCGFGIKKEFLDRYDVNDVLKDNHLTVEQIVDDVKKCL